MSPRNRPVGRKSYCGIVGAGRGVAAHLLPRPLHAGFARTVFGVAWGAPKRWVKGWRAMKALAIALVIAAFFVLMEITGSMAQLASPSLLADIARLGPVTCAAADGPITSELYRHCGTKCRRKIGAFPRNRRDESISTRGARRAKRAPPGINRAQNARYRIDRRRTAPIAQAHVPRSIKVRYDVPSFRTFRGDNGRAGTTDLEIGRGLKRTGVALMAAGLMLVFIVDFVLLIFGIC